MSKYNVVVQWTDESCDPGYQETREDAQVSANTVQEAFAAARELRPNVHTVTVRSIAGMGVHFSPAPVWRREI